MNAERRQRAAELLAGVLNLSTPPTHVVTRREADYLAGVLDDDGLFDTDQQGETP